MIAMVYDVIKIKDKEKPKMTKYVLWTNHRDDSKRDRKISLKAQNLLDAIVESEKVWVDDNKYDDLFHVYLYERVAKTNEYRKIMQSDDGRNFYVKESSIYLVRSTHRTSWETVESFKICSDK